MARRKRYPSYVTGIGRRQYRLRAGDGTTTQITPSVPKARTRNLPCRPDAVLASTASESEMVCQQGDPEIRSAQGCRAFHRKPSVNWDTKALLSCGADLLRQDPPCERTQQPLRLAKHPGLLVGIKVYAEFGDRRIEKRRSALQPMRHGNAIHLRQTITAGNTLACRPFAANAGPATMQAVRSTDRLSCGAVRPELA